MLRSESDVGKVFQTGSRMGQPKTSHGVKSEPVSTAAFDEIGGPGKIVGVGPEVSLQVNSESSHG